MGGYAWVTLATNNSYSLGALVLAHSLKKANTAHKLVVLITPAVSQPMREQLQTVFDVVKVVDVLDSKDEAHLALMKRPDLGITFTKIHCWRLVEFEKCVFLDADTLVVRNCDELFEKEEFSAAPDVSWPDCFNSGVFVYRPSIETFNKILQFAVENRSFDGGDQGLLNQFFSDWATEDIKKHLPFVYNLTSIAAYSYIPAFKHYGSETRIVHFIGSGKPWLQQLDVATRTVTPTPGSEHLAPLLQQWWDLFCEKVHPNLDKSLESNNDGMSHPPVEARSNFLPIALTDEPQTALVSEPCTPYREKDDFRQHNLPYLPFHVKGPSGELLNVEFLLASVVPPAEPEERKDEQQRHEHNTEERYESDHHENENNTQSEGECNVNHAYQESHTCQEHHETKEPEKNEESEKEENQQQQQQQQEPQQEQQQGQQKEEPPPPKDPFDYYSFFPDETCISTYLEKNVVTYQPFEDHHHHRTNNEPQQEQHTPSLPRFLTIPQNDQRQSGNIDTHSQEEHQQHKPDSEPPPPLPPPPPQREAPPQREPTPPKEEQQPEPVLERRELSKSKSMSSFPWDLTTIEAPPRKSIWKSQPDLNVDPNRRYSMPKLKPILPKQRSFSKSVPSEIPKVTQYTEFLISSEYKDPVDLPKDKTGFVETHIHKLRRSKSAADISERFGPLPYSPSPEVEKPVIKKRVPRRHFDNEYYDLTQCKRQMGNKPKPKDADKGRETVHALPALKPIIPAKDKKPAVIKKRKSNDLGEGGKEKMIKREPKKPRERKREVLTTPRNVSTDGTGNNLDEILKRLREFSKDYQHFFGVGAKPLGKTVTCKNATVQASEQDDGDCGVSETFETFKTPVSTRSKETQTPKKSTEFRQFRNYIKDQRETSQKGLLGIQDILSEPEGDVLKVASEINDSKCPNGERSTLEYSKRVDSTTEIGGGYSRKTKETESSNPGGSIPIIQKSTIETSSQPLDSRLFGLSKPNKSEQVDTNVGRKMPTQSKLEDVSEERKELPESRKTPPGVFNKHPVEVPKELKTNTGTEKLIQSAEQVELTENKSDNETAPGLFKEQRSEGSEERETGVGTQSQPEAGSEEAKEYSGNNLENETAPPVLFKEQPVGIPKEFKTNAGTQTPTQSKLEVPSEEQKEFNERTTVVLFKEDKLGTNVGTQTPTQSKLEGPSEEQKELNEHNPEKEISPVVLSRERTEQLGTNAGTQTPRQFKLEAPSEQQKDYTPPVLFKVHPIETPKSTKPTNSETPVTTKNSVQVPNSNTASVEVTNTTDKSITKPEDGAIGGKQKQNNRGTTPEVEQAVKLTDRLVTPVQQEQNNSENKRNEQVKEEEHIEAKPTEEPVKSLDEHIAAPSPVMSSQLTANKTQNGHITPRENGIQKTKEESTAETGKDEPEQDVPAKVKQEKAENGPKKPEEILCVPDFETPRTSRVSPPNTTLQKPAEESTQTGEKTEKPRYSTAVKPNSNALKNGEMNGLSSNSPEGTVHIVGKLKAGGKAASPRTPSTPLCGNVHSESFKESITASGIAGAIAQLSLEAGGQQTPQSAAASSAHEEYLRRQNWETGNMDYMGRDSFDNIWSKICQTIEAKELEENAAGSPQPPTETSKTEEKQKKPEESTESPVSLSAILQKCPEYIETLPGEPAVGPVEDDEIIFSKPENRQSCLTNIVEEEEAGTEGAPAGKTVKLSDILQSAPAPTSGPISPPPPTSAPTVVPPAAPVATPSPAPTPPSAVAAAPVSTPVSAQPLTVAPASVASTMPTPVPPSATSTASGPSSTSIAAPVHPSPLAVTPASTPVPSPSPAQAPAPTPATIPSPPQASAPASSPATPPASTPAAAPAPSPVQAPASTPASSPAQAPAPASSPATPLASTPASSPATPPASTPASSPATPPVSTPASSPATPPASTPASSPAQASAPASSPATPPASTPASSPAQASAPASSPATPPASTPASSPATPPASTPASTPAQAPAPTPAAAPVASLTPSTTSTPVPAPASTAAPASSPAQAPTPIPAPTLTPVAIPEAQTKTSAGKEADKILEEKPGVKVDPEAPAGGQEKPKPEPGKVECKTVALLPQPPSSPQPADGQKQQELVPQPEKKAEECKTVAIPSPPILFPGAPFSEKDKTQKVEEKPQVVSEPIPLPPPSPTAAPPQEPPTKASRSDSLKEEGKQKKGVFTKILEMVGVAPKEKNGTETPKSVFYDVDDAAKSKQGADKQAEIKDAGKPAGETPAEVKQATEVPGKVEEKAAPQEQAKPEEKKTATEEAKQPETLKTPEGQSKDTKLPTDSIQVAAARRSPSPKLTIPSKPPETEITTPTPPPQPDVPPRKNSALLKVDETILPTPPVPEPPKEGAPDDSVKGKVSTEIDDIIGKAKSEVESLLQERRSVEKESGDLINTMKLLMGTEQPGKSQPEEVEELRVTTEEERQRHKGEVVTSKLSDQILKAIPPPRRKAISEASASTSAIPKPAAATAEQKTAAGESKPKPTKPSSIPVPPPRNKGKPTPPSAPAPPKGKGKK